jgi:hypothetical protein
MSKVEYTSQNFKQFIALYAYTYVQIFHNSGIGNDGVQKFQIKLTVNFWRFLYWISTNLRFNSVGKTQLIEHVVLGSELFCIKFLDEVDRVK